MKEKQESLKEEVRSMVIKINALPPKERTRFVFDFLEDELKNLCVGDNDNVAGLVYVTMDLTQFKDISANRPINPESKKIAELAESIQKYGIVEPVVVNEKFEIIDGQRRRAAVRRHGLNTAVPYIFRKGGDIEVVGSMNQQQFQWNYKDWLHRYVETNHADYIEYNKLAQEYEQYMKSRSLRGLFMDGRVDPLQSGVWERGEFTIDRANLPKTLEYLEFLKKVYLIGEKDNVFVKDRNFQKALHEVIKRTKNIDFDRLLYKLRYAFNRINVRTDYKTYKKLIGDIYNMRLSGDKHHIVTDEPESPVETPQLEFKEEKKAKKKK